MFRLTIFIILSALQFLVYTRVRRWARARFPGSVRAEQSVRAVFLLFGAGVLVALFPYPEASLIPGWLVSIASRPFYIWVGAVLMLGLVILVGVILASPFRLAVAALRRLPATGRGLRRMEAHPAVVRFDASRRAFLLRGMEGFGAASLGMSAYGVLAGASGYELTRTMMQVRGLPAPLEGFTIALVSDIHSSSFMTRAQMDVYCRAIMSLGADLIAIPGDFVNSRTEEVYPFAESFSMLHAPSGVFGVMGNHDFFAPDPERVAREVDGCGVRLLRNDSTVIVKNGARFALIGIDDVGRPERAAAYMQIASRALPAGLPRVLLSHRPYFLGEAAGMGMDIVLSGHTHGGQIVLGQIGSLVITPAAIASPYIRGTYRRGGTLMYVSRGIGTVGLPMRVNCPPEITLITLARETGTGRAAA